MKSSKLTLAIVLLFALFAGITWGVNQRVGGHQHYPDYTSFSHSENGVSLLYDTLRHMGFSMGVLYRAVGGSVNVDDAVFIIQPRNPSPNDAMVYEMLSWVRRGGRLIYLENSPFTIMDIMLEGESYVQFGSLRWYRVGAGEVVTGQASNIANANLIDNPSYGEVFAYVLSSWDIRRVYFAEYYHGFYRAEGTFSQMPVWLQLVAIQLIISTVVWVWHLGKRFGSPIPMYQNIEREENEQVLTLARLYKQARK